MIYEEVQGGLPSYGHPLLLPSRQLEASLPHLGVVPAAPLTDGGVQLGQLGRLPHLALLALQPPVVDVVSDGVVEQNTVLRHDGYLPPERKSSTLSTQSTPHLNVSTSRLEMFNCPTLMFPSEGSKNL